ncbi:hypothetical protein BJY00DRAFT_275165 [Aspergillus carlsbadensis]|nr:hypothetical protein BJY00DRAFT_275165 [Aspergillus carlsbadensis]
MGDLRPVVVCAISSICAIFLRIIHSLGRGLMLCSLCLVHQYQKFRTPCVYSMALVFSIVSAGDSSHLACCIVCVSVH